MTETRDTAPADPRLPPRRSGSAACSCGSSRRWRGSSGSSPTSRPCATPAASRSSHGAATDASGAPGGGGRMAMLRGRLFEKMGAHASTVFGAFPAEFAGQIPGAADDPRFWAAGVSVIAHPWSPHVPTVHMNVRLVRTTQTWFGGGADLTPMLDARRVPADPDAVLFHAAMRGGLRASPGGRRRREIQGVVRRVFLAQAPQRAARDRRDLLRRSQQRRRRRPFGVRRRFRLRPRRRRDVRRRLSEIVRRNAARAWSAREREEQCVRRGRYVEFNLLYDRGTIFGLKTGGNVASILSSMPPEARWP